MDSIPERITYINERSSFASAMAAAIMSVTSSSTSSSFQTNLNNLKPASFFLYKPIYGIPTTRLSNRRRCRVPSSGGVLSIKAYIENPNSISGFVNKVVGSLPVVGLIARILSDEGGVGGDTIDFAEFRRRVGNNCTIMDSKAFYEFQERRGKAGEPLYVLLCCWLAAVGAGLLKSEEILEGVARLRISDDIEFEEETFLSMMNGARERRVKLRVAAPTIPMETRVEKALEAIYICSFGKNPIEEEDEKLLVIMLTAVFPTVRQTEIKRIVKEKAVRIAEDKDINNVPEPKALSKEAVLLQMKDLQFLQENSETL